jgi:hypothetical protein
MCKLLVNTKSTQGQGFLDGKFGKTIKNTLVWREGVQKQEKRIDRELIDSSFK